MGQKSKHRGSRKKKKREQGKKWNDGKLSPEVSQEKIRNRRPNYVKRTIDIFGPASSLGWKLGMLSADFFFRVHFTSVLSPWESYENLWPIKNAGAFRILKTEPHCPIFSRGKKSSLEKEEFLCPLVNGARIFVFDIFALFPFRHFSPYMSRRKGRREKGNFFSQSPVFPQREIPMKSCHRRQKIKLNFKAWIGEN